MKEEEWAIGKEKRKIITEEINFVLHSRKFIMKN
jgi:hypothetical protein